jgi:hypothetical protein
MGVTMPRKSKKADDGEHDVFDKMLVSLVEILEEKGIITHEEWEKRIEQKINESVGLARLEVK